MFRSVRVAERLALPTSDHRVGSSNPAGGEILPEPKRRFIAQSLSCSPFHRLEMTEILLKGRKTLTHPSIHFMFTTINSCILSFSVELVRIDRTAPTAMELPEAHHCQFVSSLDDFPIGHMVYDYISDVAPRKRH